MRNIVSLLSVFLLVIFFNGNTFAVNNINASEISNLEIEYSEVLSDVNNRLKELEAISNNNLEMFNIHLKFNESIVVHYSIIIAALTAIIAAIFGIIQYFAKEKLELELKKYIENNIREEDIRAAVEPKVKDYLDKIECQFKEYDIKFAELYKNITRECNNIGKQ